MANLFVNFPTFQEPPMPPTDTTPPLSLKFDFSHYGISNDAKTITIPDAQCMKSSFIVVVEADGLTPGRLYSLNFELLNPSTSKRVFDPPNIQFYASSVKQKLTTVANVDPQYNYIVKATITQTDTAIAASDMVAVSCVNIPILPTPTPTPTVAARPRVLFDNRPILEIKAPNRCSEQLNIIATIFNAQIGKTYKYDFLSLTQGASVVLSPSAGLVTAGAYDQNINTVLTVVSSESSLVSIQVKVYEEKYPNIIIGEDILLIKCYECK